MENERAEDNRRRREHRDSYIDKPRIEDQSSLVLRARGDEGCQFGKGWERKQNRHRPHPYRSRLAWGLLQGLFVNEDRQCSLQQSSELGTILEHRIYHLFSLNPSFSLSLSLSLARALSCSPRQIVTRCRGTWRVLPLIRNAPASFSVPERRFGKGCWACSAFRHTIFRSPSRKLAFIFPFWFYIPARRKSFLSTKTTWCKNFEL